MFYSSVAFADKLLQYLDERNEAEKQRPFFAYLPFSAPHWPLQAPEDDMLQYRGRYDNGPEHLRQERLQGLKERRLISKDVIAHNVVAAHHATLVSKEWGTLSASEKAISSRIMEAYAGMVHSMDKQIGRVLDRLRETGELDNTFVVFMSDNGAEGLLMEAQPVIPNSIFDHIAKYYDNSVENIGRYNSYVWYGPHWASAATAPSWLYKAFSAEGGIHVPLILRYPALAGQRLGGSVERSFSTVMDLAPTMLELAGVQHPGRQWKGRQIEPMRGKSWVQYLTAKAKGDVETAKVGIHNDEAVHGWELFDRTAVRKGKWKATFIPKPYGPEVWQLFDLEEDPGETHDLSGQEQGKLKDLLAAYKRYHEEVGIVGEAPQYGTLVI